MSVRCGITAYSAFRSHVEEMRKYADEIAPSLGDDSAIVRRIRTCADQCSHTLDLIEKLTRPA